MKKVIAIVEDEKDLNELVKRYLEKEEYEVRSYLDFDEAYSHTSDEDIHLWILDIMLGDKSGFDLSDDYITKPFSPKELVLRVNNLIRRIYKDEAEHIKVDGYEIDEAQRIVIEDDKQIDLTTKEFELLMMFVNNRGTAFPREQILSQVWEENYFGSDRVVDDTLRRLRKKMPNLSIHTIYGFGYRLG